MTTQESTLVLVISFAIILLLVFMQIVRKNIEGKKYRRFKDIELDDSYLNKLSIIKEEIDAANKSEFEDLIAQRKEYYINDAIKRSGSVSKGKIIEHFAPFLVDDLLNPNEIVFMGSPIDLISFTNIDSNKELSIDFIEIKSGNATLNKKQRIIRNAILENRIFYKKVFLK